ncbi:Protein of unknown function [Pyronema omphalodes CBS 100304]|uniref:Uncharacterized protein n=1 Tax=Pyronema omphalodes (strain CBS 100304) TaxID=1076935 RepID=U4LCY2_PYROM|nr:Protein of unknown function [Pyronema omphalodes CBS 100304]
MSILQPQLGAEEEVSRLPRQMVLFLRSAFSQVF